MSENLAKIHSYLVHPGKHSNETVPLPGADVPLSGKLFDMLSRIFENAERECTYDISFNPTDDGKQENPCRDLMLAYLKRPSMDSGRKIASRLGSVTTGRSGLGLLFLLTGKEGQRRKIVLSRFPADSAILAEEATDGLNVQFLEKVFMKSATSYKAAAYAGTSSHGEFWDGRAIDKQINHEVIAISNYWIKDFLESDFRATSAQGTKRLAVAVLGAMRKAPNLTVKQEIAAAAQLAKGLQGKSTTIADFCGSFSLSQTAADLIFDQCPNEHVITERFRFSTDEFAKHVSIRSMELDNGAILMAPAAEFDSVFERIADNRTGTQKFSTKGKVVHDDLKRGGRK